MIIWLNGTFGAGKTATAKELLPLVPRYSAIRPGDGRLHAAAQPRRPTGIRFPALAPVAPAGGGDSRRIGPIHRPASDRPADHLDPVLPRRDRRWPARGPANTLPCAARRGRRRTP